jgi:hypothetical protein
MTPWRGSLNASAVHSERKRSERGSAPRFNTGVKEAIRHFQAAPEEFNIHGLAAALNTSRGQAEKYLGYFKELGWVEKTGQGWRYRKVVVEE